jgi:3,4-dihydroxy 2-butanone 4-phosphate synthase/GTP cyclohydrolase II
MSAPFSTIEEALEDFKRGKFVLVTDDASRENEGDLIMAAEFVTLPPSTSWRATRAALSAYRWKASASKNLGWA